MVKRKFMVLVSLLFCFFLSLQLKRERSEKRGVRRGARKKIEDSHFLFFRAEVGSSLSLLLLAPKNNRPPPRDRQRFLVPPPPAFFSRGISRELCERVGPPPARARRGLFRGEDTGFFCAHLPLRLRRRVELDDAARGARETAHARSPVPLPLAVSIALCDSTGLWVREAAMRLSERVSTASRSRESVPRETPFFQSRERREENSKRGAPRSTGSGGRRRRRLTLIMRPFSRPRLALFEAPSRQVPRRDVGL